MPVKAEIKELEEAIRKSLKAPKINGQMQQICRLDMVKKQGKHKGEFQKKVLSVP